MNDYTLGEIYGRAGRSGRIRICNIYHYIHTGGTYNVSISYYTISIMYEFYISISILKIRNFSIGFFVLT